MSSCENPNVDKDVLMTRKLEEFSWREHLMKESEQAVRNLTERQRFVSSAKRTRVMLLCDMQYTASEFPNHTLARCNYSAIVQNLFLSLGSRSLPQVA